ncbi:MAG TPA: HupE/UreJ family protein [Thermoanaerobaculia bacterium]|nr:HupE/UreJ family protein [Thermoanaerobaculia bacterium]
MRKPSPFLHPVLCVLAVLCVLVLFSAPARAHELGKVQMYTTFLKNGTYRIEMVMDDEHLTPAESSGGRLLRQLVDGAAVLFDGRPVKVPAARLAPPDPSDPPGRTTVVLSGAIPGGAHAFRFAETARIGSYPLVLKTEGSESSVWQWQEGGPDQGKLPGTPFELAKTVVPPTRWQVIQLYLALGYSHILPKGLDHILFVVGIFLLSRKVKPVLAQVTAFTVAHTLTLALTIYGVVSLPSSIVEPLIALSIAYVAIENLLTRELKARRIVLVFLFGLLHGMGFAGVLSQLGLPRSEFLPALVSFNLGVEAGQLTVIAAAFLLVGLPFRHRSWYRGRVVVPISCLIAAVGLFWSVQRAFF